MQGVPPSPAADNGALGVGALRRAAHRHLAAVCGAAQRLQAAHTVLVAEPRIKIDETRLDALTP